MSEKFMVFVPGSPNAPEGPLDLPELERRIRSKALADDAMVCLVGGEKWVPLAQLIKKKPDEPDKFEVKVGESVVGPVTRDQIRRGFETGKIPTDALVRRVGTDAWKSISSVLVEAGPGASTIGEPPASQQPAILQSHQAGERRGASPPTADPRIATALRAVVAGLALLLVVGIAFLVLGKRTTKDSGTLPNPAPVAVAAGDLNLDFSAAAAVKIPRASRGALGMSWGEFQASWSQAASGFSVPETWTRTDVRAGGLWTATLTVGPGVEADVFGAGRDTVVNVSITARTKAATSTIVFDAIEILRKVVEPELDGRKLYEGLGLLTPGTATTRLFETAHGWRLSFDPENSKLEVEASGAEKPTIGLDHGFALDIVMGLADDLHTIGEFEAVNFPATKGKTFQDAAKVCQGAELELCSATEWARACGEFNQLGAMQTWTASYSADYSALQIRGGASGCDSSSSSKASQSSPERVGLCCTPAIALPAQPEVQFAGLWVLPVKTYERGLNLRDQKLLQDALAPTLARFYTVEDVSRERAIKMSLDYMTATPNFWSVTETCSFDKQEDATMVRCLRNVFNGDKGMVVKSAYALDRNFGLTYVRDPDILRRMSPL